MSRTTNDIKQNALSTYLGFPLLVNFGTAANNYQDADEVGTVVNRAYDDVLEKALRMYPWSFCRKDGIIVGTKVQNQQDERFMYYANIDEFLNRIIPSSATISQTTGTSLTRLTINVKQFETAIRNAISELAPDSQTREMVEDMLKYGAIQTNLAFTCTEVDAQGHSKWVITGPDDTMTVNDISEYGITWYFRNIPIVTDVLTVSYISPKPEYTYVCMQAAFYDPRHWSKCFEWKQYGTNLIKFNLPKLYVEYTIDIDPKYFPAYFVDYLSCALALECCAPLRVESKIPILAQQLTSVYLDARKQDSMGEPAPASFDNIIDEARNAL